MLSYIKYILIQTYSLIINPNKLKKVNNKMIKSIKSLTLSTKSNKTDLLSWQSFILFFKNPQGILLVDKVYIFLGKVPENYYSFYINFKNWITKNNELYYFKNKKVIKVNPKDVHLHIKVGNTEFKKDYFYDNPENYLHFFPSIKGKIYNTIKSQLNKNNIIIVDLTESDGLYNKTPINILAKNIKNPTFKNYKHQIYGKKLNHVIFSGIF